MSIIASGCSSSPELIPFEQDKIEAKGVVPVKRCTWPELNEAVIDGRTVVYMEAEQLRLQAICQETEQANHRIATENAEAVDQAVAGFNTLVDKAELHQQNAENELSRVDEERQRKANEVLFYQGLLALVLIAVAL